MYRVLYRDAGNAGHFEDVEAETAPEAAWKVAVSLDSPSSTFVSITEIQE